MNDRRTLAPLPPAIEHALPSPYGSTLAIHTDDRGAAFRDSMLKRAADMLNDPDDIERVEYAAQVMACLFDVPTDATLADMLAALQREGLLTADQVGALDVVAPGDLLDSVPDMSTETLPTPRPRAPKADPRRIPVIGSWEPYRSPMANMSGLTLTAGECEAFVTSVYGADVPEMIGTESHSWENVAYVTNPDHAVMLRENMGGSVVGRWEGVTLDAPRRKPPIVLTKVLRADPIVTRHDPDRETDIEHKPRTPRKPRPGDTTSSAPGFIEYVSERDGAPITVPGFVGPVLVRRLVSTVRTLVPGTTCDIEHHAPTGRGWTSSATLATRDNAGRAVERSRKRAQKVRGKRETVIVPDVVRLDYGALVADMIADYSPATTSATTGGHGARIVSGGHAEHRTVTVPVKVSDIPAEDRHPGVRFTDATGRTVSVRPIGNDRCSVTLTDENGKRVSRTVRIGTVQRTVGKFYR